MLQFHVGLLVITLSSLKLHTKNNACFFWKSWVALKRTVSWAVVCRVALKRASFNAEDAQSGIPWPSHTLGVALATGRLRHRWCPETDLTSSRWDAVSAHLCRRQESCTHALASSPRFCSRLGLDQDYWAATDLGRWTAVSPAARLNCLLCSVCRRTVLLKHKHVACNTTHNWYICCFSRTSW